MTGPAIVNILAPTPRTKPSAAVNIGHTLFAKTFTLNQRCAIIKQSEVLYVKRIFCIFCVITMLFLLCSCKDDSSHKANEYETMKTSATKDSVEEFVSLLKNIEPSGLISGYKFDEETCYNVTPPKLPQKPT